ncbi:hypothetical protein EJ063_13995 [Vibrio aquaticus]|uniref:Uncharacterized protein n=2 Tax=Vibrio TaxID=662 RepID=A0A4Y8WGK1_9VIBR|nr:hypothetical protein EJ063_13995 [Vibrio aquaticus]TFH91458.1 hypothetical protein ELS82_11325 [Vibrio ouci]
MSVSNSKLAQSYLGLADQTNFVQTLPNKILYKGSVIGLKFRTIFDQAGLRPNISVWLTNVPALTN